MSKVFRPLVDKFPDLEPRLPIYLDDDPDNIPDREYFWNVLQTLYPEVSHSLLEAAYKRRANGRGDTFESQISIRADFLEVIQNAPFFSSKPRPTSNHQSERAGLWHC